MVTSAAVAAATNAAAAAGLSSQEQAAAAGAAAANVIGDIFNGTWAFQYTSLPLSMKQVSQRLNFTTL